MKILLTKSPVVIPNEHNFLFSDQGDLTLSQLASMVNKQHEVKVFDSWIQSNLWKSKDVLKSISNFKPDIIGISHTANYDTELMMGLVSKLKKQYPEAIIIGGGHTATAKYKYLLYRGFDVIVLGEGELTFSELVDEIAIGKNDFSEIKGIAFKKDKQIILNEKRQVMANLDVLPHASRSTESVLKSNIFPNRHTASIETSRGCPFGCNFCSASAFWDKNYRKKSNKYILQELASLQETYGPMHIYFIDDCFCLNVDEYSDLFTEIINCKLDLKWWAQLRSDTIAENPELIKLAKLSGMYGALIGFEEYNEQNILQLGKKITVEHNLQAAKIFRNNNLLSLGMHVVGIPGQTLKDLCELYKRGRKNSDLFWTTFYRPALGTASYEEFKKSNLKQYIKNQKKMKRFMTLLSLLHYFNPKTILRAFFVKNKPILRMQYRIYCTFFYEMLYKGLFCFKMKKSRRV